MTTKRRHAAVHLVATLVILSACAVVSAAFGNHDGHHHRAHNHVVLGSAHFLTWGHGFGTAHPSLLNAGGDAQLVISSIRWRHWGRARTRGVGRSYSLRYIRGAYYSRLVRAELQAYRIGRCSPNGPRAYLGLRVRMPPRPGAPMGPWFIWSGRHGLCRYP
jgi:hypothetical protein